MTAEKLHDALSLMPADLIAATDKLRTQPRRRLIPWSRLATIAACLAVVLLGSWLFSAGLFFGGSTEKAAPMEIAAQDAAEWKEAYPAQGENRTITSGSTTLETKAAWEEAGEEVVLDEPAAYAVKTDAVWKNKATQYSLTPENSALTVCGTGEPEITVIRSRSELEDYYGQNRNDRDMESFWESCRIYDDSWFDENDLLLVSVLVPAGDEGCYLGPEIIDLLQNDDGSWELLLTGYASPETGKTINCHIMADIQKDTIAPEDTVTVVMETACEETAPPLP